MSNSKADFRRDVYDSSADLQLINCSVCHNLNFLPVFHWEDKNFSLCYRCVFMLYEQAFGKPYGEPKDVSGVGARKPALRIPDDLKWSVWERDDFTCRTCGGRNRLALDVLVQLDKGGTLDKSNLVTRCRSCKGKKRKTYPAAEQIKGDTQ